LENLFSANFNTFKMGISFKLNTNQGFRPKH
jgi:hypothetical protein